MGLKSPPPGGWAIYGCGIGWYGVTHAVVKIANYTTNYDFVDIRRRVGWEYTLHKSFYALNMRKYSLRWNIAALKTEEKWRG